MVTGVAGKVPRRKLSIVVINFNYGQFVGDAIRSALDVRWDNKEVIVVDDGSTDNSRQIISRFGSQITPIFKENGGQSSAANAALAHCTGDVVLFLDSDDMLFPTVAEEVFRAWHEGVAAVESGLVDIDLNGNALFRPHQALAKRRARESSVALIQKRGNPNRLMSILTNAWSRDFLVQVFPLPVRVPEDNRPVGAFYGLFFDRYLQALAPFFGEVVSLPSPQGYRRVHGRNDSGVGRAVSAEYALNRCLEVARTVAKANQVLKEMGKSSGFSIDWQRDESIMQFRLIAQKLIPERCPRANLAWVFLKYCRSVWLSGEDVTHKCLFVTWAILILSAPASIAEWAIRLRACPAVRPRILTDIVQVCRGLVIKSSRRAVSSVMAHPIQYELIEDMPIACAQNQHGHKSDPGLSSSDCVAALGQ